MAEYAAVLFVERKDNKVINEKDQEMILEHFKEACLRLGLKDFEGNVITPWLLYPYDEEEITVAYAMFDLYYWEDSPEEIEELKEFLRLGVELDKLIPDTYNYESNIEIL